MSHLKLPKKLIEIKNVDKGWTESWSANRGKNYANFPHPTRCVLLGPVSTGKSFLMKTLLLHQRPMFKELYIIHGDAGDTHEFDDLEPTLMMSEFPDVSFYDGKVKTAVFIDDFEFSSMNKEQTARCNKLFRYVSSHKHVSVFCSHQLCFSLPSLIRRLANVWIIWKPRSKAELRLIANRVAMEPTELEYIFDNICTGHRDSLCIDFNKDTPAHLRKNLFEKIDPDNIKKGVIMEKLEKLQKKGSIEKTNPILDEKLKINKLRKGKYEQEEAGYVSNDSDED
jgi:hypothetical protein